MIQVLYLAISLIIFWLLGRFLWQWASAGRQPSYTTWREVTAYDRRLRRALNLWLGGVTALMLLVLSFPYPLHNSLTALMLSPQEPSHYIPLLYAIGGFVLPAILFYWAWSSRQRPPSGNLLLGLVGGLWIGLICAGAVLLFYPPWLNTVGVAFGLGGSIIGMWIIVRAFPNYRDLMLKNKALRIDYDRAKHQTQRARSAPARKA